MRAALALCAVALLGGCGGDDAPTWERAPSLLHGRSAHAVAGNGTVVYAIAGTGPSGEPVLAVERFDGEAWRNETRLPGAGLNAPAAALVGSRLYVLGGFEATTNVATDRVLVYDTRTKDWSDAAPLPAARGGHAAIALDGSIHVVGGGDSSSTLAHHSVYDPAADSWSESKPLPAAKGSPAALVVDGKLWVLGGRSGSDDFGTVDTFDPATGRWEPGPALPPRGTHGAVVHDGDIHVFGGESQAEGRTLDDVLRLDDGEWRRVATLPTSRGYARTVAFGEDVLVVGGTTLAGASHASPGSDRVDRFRSR